MASNNYDTVYNLQQLLLLDTVDVICRGGTEFTHNLNNVYNVHMHSCNGYIVYHSAAGEFLVL